MNDPIDLYLDSVEWPVPVTDRSSFKDLMEKGPQNIEVLVELAKSATEPKRRKSGTYVDENPEFGWNGSL